MVFVFGFVNIVVIMVGKEIGKKDFYIVEIYVKKFLLYFFFLSLLGVVLFLIVKFFIIKKFVLNVEVEDYLNFILNILFYYIFL